MDISKIYENNLNLSKLSGNWHQPQQTQPDYSSLETLQYWPHQVVLIALYSTIAVVSFALNSVTIAVLVKCDKICTELYVYLINLSVSDIVMSLLCIPFTYTSFILNRWIFPHFLCPLVNFAQICSVFVSIWTLTVIGIDRYFAIINPLDNGSAKCLLLKCGRKKKLFSIVLIWLVGVCTASVQLLYTRVVALQFGKDTLFDCRENMPQQYARLYTIFLFVSAFGLPLLILVYVYSVIGYQVWRHVAPGNPHHSRDHNNSLTREKVIKILLLIVLLFFLCWFPLQIFTLLVEFMDNFLQIRSARDYRLFVYSYLVSHILAMSHSFVNPIVYCFISRNFWQNFCCLTRRFLLRATRCCKSDEEVIHRRPCSRDTVVLVREQSQRTGHSLLQSLQSLHRKRPPLVAAEARVLDLSRGQASLNLEVQCNTLNSWKQAAANHSNTIELNVINL